ncbi:Histidinol-phosphatase [Spathaspora sp. JA1]|nr:Histidinol-phosphatase [Spathaspora sp. JA1]
MHTHHSHSGSYISHATDTLESMVAKYDLMGFELVCLTEHMPRLDSRFLYPEETDRNYTIDDLVLDFNKYIAHGVTLQQRYDMKIVLGFEVEGIDDPHIEYCQRLLAQHPSVQMMVGSVHFVNQIPIDFNVEMWKEARESTKEGTTRALFRDYFKLQYRVLESLNPVIVGHFDLIRLLLPDDDVDVTTGKLTREVDIESDWPEVWELIVRNIKYVKEYGGLFELNSSALRKGWDTPYPKRDIASAIIEHGDARFCLSDDAHSLSQIGIHYDKTWEYVKSLGVSQIYCLQVTSDNKVQPIARDISTLDNSTFWNNYK